MSTRYTAVQAMLFICKLNGTCIHRAFIVSVGSAVHRFLTRRAGNYTGVVPDLRMLSQAAMRREKVPGSIIWLK